jgi:hypothetical protein
MKGSRTPLRKVLPEREGEEAAVPEAIERLISRDPPTGSGIPFEAWRSWHRYGFIACPAYQVAVLFNPKSPKAETVSRDVEAAAHAIGLQIHILTASSESDTPPTR